MKMVIKPRGGGKTTDMIKYASEHCLYIVVLNQQRIDEVWNLANKLNIKIPFPITMHDLVENRRGRSPRIKRVVIDELDDCIENWLNVRIEKASLTEK